MHSLILRLRYALVFSCVFAFALALQGATETLVTNEWKTLLEIRPEPKNSNDVVVDRLGSHHRYFRLRKP